jgi:hypothetical protein
LPATARRKLSRAGKGEVTMKRRGGGAAHAPVPTDDCLRPTMVHPQGHKVSAHLWSTGMTAARWHWHLLDF